MHLHSISSREDRDSGLEEIKLLSGTEVVVRPQPTSDPVAFCQTPRRGQTRIDDCDAITINDSF